MYRLFFLFVLCFAAPATAQTFQGRELTVIDGRATETPGPLLVALHGALGTGSQVSGDGRLNRLATTHGIRVLGPNGQRRRWQDGRLGPDRSDVQYLSDLIEAEIAAGNADPRRIFLIGHSNGGGMAMRMACDRPDLIAGIAVIATKVLLDYPCADGRAVPAIFFHGTNDRIAPHEGRPDGHGLGGTYSAAQSMAIWSRRNGCNGPRAPLRIDRRPGDGTSVDVFTYAGCRAPLVQVVINGGGHGWPGSSQGTVIGGRITREIEAGQAAWRFFSGL